MHRCDHCPLDRLGAAQCAEKGLLIRRALDLLSALKLAVHIGLDEIRGDEFWPCWSSPKSEICWSREVTEPGPTHYLSFNARPICPARVTITRKDDRQPARSRVAPEMEPPMRNLVLGAGDVARYDGAPTSRISTSHRSTRRYGRRFWRVQHRKRLGGKPPAKFAPISHSSMRSFTTFRTSVLASGTGTLSPASDTSLRSSVRLSSCH